MKFENLICGVKISEDVFDKATASVVEKFVGRPEIELRKGLEEICGKGKIKNSKFAQSDDGDSVVFGDLIEIKKDLQELKPISPVRAKEIAEISSKLFGTRNNWREVKTYVSL